MESDGLELKKIRGIKHPIITSSLVLLLPWARVNF
jgi:hypothetical protein